MLEAEQEMNNGSTSCAYQDGLFQRQKFCKIANAVWGLGIACYPNEEIVGVDLNGDGLLQENDNIPDQEELEMSRGDVDE